MVNWAYAQDAGGAAGQGYLSILMLVAMFAIFYFLLIRPQQKKAKEHRAFLENLKRGDRVVTTGGILGEIIAINDQILTLEIADKVRVEVSRAYIAGFAPKK